MAKRQRKKPDLPVTTAPTLIVADADGVEARAAEEARRHDLPVRGYVPLGRSGSALRPATFRDHPLQALKWNTRAADLTIAITRDAMLHGRAQWAVCWAQRYRKPWLHLYGGALDAAALAGWLRTYRWRSIQIVGALEHQLGAAAGLIAPIVAAIGDHAARRRSA